MQSALEKERLYESVFDLPYNGAGGSSFTSWGSYVNRQLKVSLVNWGLTDAAYYVGGYRDEFQWAVAKAMAKAADGIDAHKDCAAVVTHSLGSVIAVDTFLKLLTRSMSLDGNPFPWNPHDHEQVVKMLAGTKDHSDDRPIPFYMFANQYALIKPAEKTSQKSTGAEQTPAESNPTTMAKQIQRTIEAAKGVDPLLMQAMNENRLQVQLVAFTDPEDLLSYPFALRLKDEDMAPYRNQDIPVGSVNVLVHNRNLIWLFVLANPLNAHLDYEKNPVVLRRILDGADKDQIAAASRVLRAHYEGAPTPTQGAKPQPQNTGGPKTAASERGEEGG